MRHWQSVLSVSAVLLLACSNGASKAPQESMAAAAPPPPPEASAAPAAAYWTTQKLIRTAELRIEVKNVQAAAHAADSLVKQSGALVAESRISQDAQERHEAQLVVRVPSDHLSGALMALRQLGDVKEDAVSTQDVTKEYADLDTRLAVKEQTVARLRALIDNRTAKLSDVLDVERELARAVTELEEMKGERRYYDQQIALSTIKLTLEDHAAARSSQLTDPISASFHNALDVLATSVSVLIYLITYLLPWMVVAVPAGWFVHRWRTRVRKERSADLPRP
jgi:hypothetical protein